MATKTKLKKRTTAKVGDVHVTSNYRLKGYNKQQGSNGRMTVLTLKDNEGKQTVNAIVGAEHKGKLSNGYVSIDKNRNRFLKKKSVVSLENHNSINSTARERRQGESAKRNTDVSDERVFTRIGKIHWKDKKQIKKALA